MEEWLDVLLRLGVATLIGGAIGLNRELHRKPTGIRTLGLVGLGSALIVMTIRANGVIDSNAASRVIQGLITGIGFLGTGVIMRTGTSNKVHGLTTAATIWVTACLGVACGFGAWHLVTITVALVALLLLAGGPVERVIHRRFGEENGSKPPE